LQALDFWVRNPDYLADELLNEFEAGRMDRHELEMAESILRSDEPDIRRFPMVRWLYGAYEPLDDALAILVSAGLVKLRRQPKSTGVGRHDFYLLHSGHHAVEQLLVQAPPLSWYADRASLVAQIAGDRGGGDLKARQYEQREYGETKLGAEISGIRGRVLERLQRMRAA
jgi:hypothetical protein